MDKKKYHIAAFSLVEMLMALLVASILLAALAPVMTRKMDENVAIKGLGTYERLDYANAYYDDKEWSVPAGVNIIKVTAVGGGGAGGSATYGYKKFNYTGGVQNFTIPNGVTKIRVYAIAGGGGGSAGGDGTSTAYGNIPAIPANTEGTITAAGSYVFANSITPPDTYKVPAINANCQNSGFTKWTLVSDNSTQLTPNTKISKIGINGGVNVTLSKVTACGAGGGGGCCYTPTGGGGGTGAYLANQALSVTGAASAIKIKVGSGGSGGAGLANSTSNNPVSASTAGGSGGTGATNGANGGNSSYYNSTGAFISTGSGGGGGGSTGIYNAAGTLVFEAAGGGGGGGGCSRFYSSANTFNPSCWSGSGGAGGGRNGGAGGGGAVGAGATMSGGAGGASYVAGGSGGKDAEACNGGGGGGGGGIGGNGGNGAPVVSGNVPISVVPNSIFGTGNCSGAAFIGTGSPGAIKLWYSAAGITNGLKCTYYAKTNAGAGGGTGQIWIGEVNVTPGETLSVNIGKGGNGAAAKNKNGANGGNTVISGSKTGSIITLLGGRGGVYSASGSTGGVSGGCSTQKQWKNWTGLNVFDTSNQTNLTNIGNGKAGGTASANNFTGGKGGQAYSIENTVLEGGNGGAGNSNGSAPNSVSYGTGGGGGGGNANVAVNTAGLGGNGGNGYVYIEWGEGSGGGGQSGQVVIDGNVWVSGGVSKVKMIIGKGGAPKQETSVNWSGLLGVKGEKGGDTIVLVDDEVVLTAKGGYGGNPGILSHGTGGGKGTGEAENIPKSVAGDDGENEKGGAGASLTQDIFPLLGAVDKIVSNGGAGGSISTSGEGKAGSGYGAGGGGGIFLNNRAYQGGKGSNGMVYIEYKN